MGGRGGKARARVDANAPGQPPPPEQPDAPPPEPAATEQDQPASLENRIQDAYLALSVKEQDWVRLSKLREMLGNPDKDEWDQTLKTMLRSEMVHLVPDSNTKLLTPADHESAIRLGSEHKHLIAIEPDFFEHAPSAREEER